MKDKLGRSLTSVDENVIIIFFLNSRVCVFKRIYVHRQRHIDLTLFAHRGWLVSSCFYTWTGKLLSETFLIGEQDTPSVPFV